MMPSAPRFLSYDARQRRDLGAAALGFVTLVGAALALADWWWGVFPDGDDAAVLGDANVSAP